MFHRVKNVTPLDDLTLFVEFINDEKRLYDVKPLLEKWEVFNDLKYDYLFNNVKVDQGGYGISWNEDIDLACDELYFNGVESER